MKAKVTAGTVSATGVGLARAPVREEGELPTLPSLVRKTLELYDMAVERVGETNGNTWANPDTHSAIKCIELTAKLCGYLGDGRTMDKATLERELDRLGFRLVAKVKRVG